MGSRLRPLTDTKPKCLVKVDDKPILHYQLENFHKVNIDDITIITGYKENEIQIDGIKKVHNKDYATTNMVHSLFCASDLFDGSDDILISYGDIIYTSEVLECILKSDAAISVVADKNFKPYWYARMQVPLSDLESFCTDSQGYIEEFGTKTSSWDKIEAQYIGLIKITKEYATKFYDFYTKLDPKSLYDGKSKEQMYMTTFLRLFQKIHPLTPVYIHNGWIEIDTPSDRAFTNFLIPNRHYSITEVFLKSLQDKTRLDPDTFAQLDKICKKVDVVQEVYQVYSEGFKTKQTDVVVSDATYRLLADTLLRFALIHKDIKFFNSYLKLVDLLKKKNIAYTPNADLEKHFLSELQCD